MAEAGETRLAKQLALVEEELKLLKDTEVDNSNMAKVFHREREELNDQIAALEGTNTGQETKISSLEGQNTALEDTLDEYRRSHEELRKDVHKAHTEKLKLQSTLDAMQYRAEEALRVRSSMRDRLGDLREEMRSAATQMAQREANWHREDQEHRKRYEVLTARLGAEARTRERFEQEMERLETRERDGRRLKIALDEARNANIKLEEQLKQVGHEASEHRKAAEQFARQIHSAQEDGRVEVQRVRVLMQAEVDKVDKVRREIEAELGRTRTQLEHSGIAAETAKERHDMALEQEFDTRKGALRDQQETHHRALQEQSAIYEQRIEELRQQHGRALENALEDRKNAEARLVDEHKTVLGRALEDKDRSEMLLNERLVLSDAKFEHLQDKVVHLEEKLEVAKSAAQAAAQAARSARSPVDQAPAPFFSTASSAGRAPEKISPQALRESIAVLQEQLQEREGRIEQLEAELEPIRETPAKLKERETEVTWLRELLGVRQDDLTDLINALARPTFNREAVKNAAIRIRANLQMELQEKERLMNGGGQGAAAVVASQVAPALASLSNFATPKAAQLAAAIGSWRKGPAMGTPSGVGQFSHTAGSAASSRAQTPSKPRPNNAQNFLSGLMTPPQSNVRRTPSPHTAGGAEQGDARELSEHVRPPSSMSSASSRAQTSPRARRRVGKQPAIAERALSPPPRLETPPP
ncbi:MAG: hypothetical protein INR71_08915, partial [Terriglobus roseus]|nr:hypothetical protein [Terriglobus roseus]